MIYLNSFCQAQFQSSPSPVQWELRLALSLIITTHLHPRPPGKVEMQLEISHIWSVGSIEWHCIEETQLTRASISLTKYSRCAN